MAERDLLKSSETNHHGGKRHGKRHAKHHRATTPDAASNDGANLLSKSTHDGKRTHDKQKNQAKRSTIMKSITKSTLAALVFSMSLVPAVKAQDDFKNVKAEDIKLYKLYDKGLKAKDAKIADVKLIDAKLKDDNIDDAKTTDADLNKLAADKKVLYTLKENRLASDESNKVNPDQIKDDLKDDDIKGKGLKLSKLSA